MDKIGYGYREMEEQGIISPVIGIVCDYKSMTKFGDQVWIKTKVKEFNGIKLKIEYQVLDDRTKEVRVTGESKIASCLKKINRFL